MQKFHPKNHPKYRQPALNEISDATEKIVL